MITKEFVELLREISKDCIKTPIDELISNPDWGNVNFEDVKTDLERAFDIFNDLLILPINILPDSVINTMMRDAGTLRDTIETIKNFDITSGGYAVRNRDNIANALKRKVDDLYRNSQSWIPYLVYQKGDAQKKIDELADVAASAKNEIETKKKEIEEIVIASREASALVGVTHFTADFFAEAESLKKSAHWWLATTGALGIITLLASMRLFYLVATSVTEAFQAIPIKLIILGLLFSATLWCGRIYKALMHQVTVNRHRANSIKTFQAFTQAASNDAVRDAVLMETTKAIFSQHATGYLDKETPGSSDQLRIIEFAKQMPTPPQAGTTKSS